MGYVQFVAVVVCTERGCWGYCNSGHVCLERSVGGGGSAHSYHNLFGKIWCTLLLLLLGQLLNVVPGGSLARLKCAWNELFFEGKRQLGQPTPCQMPCLALGSQSLAALLPKSVPVFRRVLGFLSFSITFVFHVCSLWSPCPSVSFRKDLPQTPLALTLFPLPRSSVHFTAEKCDLDAATLHPGSAHSSAGAADTALLVPVPLPVLVEPVGCSPQPCRRLCAQLVRV